MLSEIEVRQSIVNVCKRLYDRNMLAAADGNVSVRISDRCILITPSGLAKAFIETKDIAVLDIDGKIVEGNPSAERLMHLEIYRRCPLAKAVVHAHPPHAIAWSVISPRLTELPGEVLSEVILATGRIPIVPYARPTTKNMGSNLSPYLPACRAMILERHGAVGWGEDLNEAINAVERIEHSAQILWLGKTLGDMTPLPKDEVAALKAMRESMGDRIL